jgi:regulatory protein
MRITKIEPQKRRPGRKNIYADGTFVAGVSDETLIRLALRAGDEITPDTATALQRFEGFFHAKSIALRLLSTRPRTEREIRDRLREKEFGDDEIARTIDELLKANLLNDREFARMFIRDALALKPLGRIALRRKLLLLGVEKSVADETLDEAFANLDLHDVVLAASKQFLKKARALRKGEDPRKLRSRLTAFLLRRGYPWNVAGPIVKSLTGTDEHNEHDE